MKRRLSRLQPLATTANVSLLISVVLLLALAVTGNNPLRSQQTRSSAVGVSPLLFGANIDPQIAGNPAAIKDLHVQTIRMGDGPHFASNLQAIKRMGLAPLVIIHGCGVADPIQRVTVDTNMVKTAQQIF